MANLQTPQVPEKFDPGNERQWRALVARFVSYCFRRGEDVELGSGRLIIKHATSGIRYLVEVDETGTPVLKLTAL